MSNSGVFLVGFFITLVVFVALGILAYGIRLEGRDLDAERRERESLVAPLEQQLGDAVTSGARTVAVTAPQELASAAVVEVAGAQT